MKSKLEKVNRYLGWTLLIGIVITEAIFIKVTNDMGRMAPFIAFFVGLIFMPFVITSIAGFLNRKHKGLIEILIRIGAIVQTCIPIGFPLFFDWELIYISLVGAVFAVLIILFRKRMEVQLIIINGLGFILWAFISIIGIVAFYH